MRTLILRRCLTEFELLRIYAERDPSEPSLRRILRHAFLSERRHKHDLPDHYFDSWRRHNVDERPGQCLWDLLKGALDAYCAEYLTLRGTQLHVEFDRFGRWQEEITAVSPLPIVAYRIFRTYGGPSGRTPPALASYVDVHLRQFTHSLLIAPFEPAVEDLIAKGGLNEVHLHLNGSTEVDLLWQDAMRDPHGFSRIIRDAFGLEGRPQNERLAELYDQVAIGLTPGEIAGHLRFARRLRTAIIGTLFGGERGWTAEALAHDDAERQVSCSFGALPGLLAGALGRLADDDDPRLRTEMLLLILIYARLERQSDPDLARMLHAYLLVLNAVMVKFCVQQIEQRGFDQFQKLTYTDFRRRAERAYGDRLLQISLGGRDLRVVEGRFTPPETAAKARELLTRIIRGYRQSRARDPTLRPTLMEQPDEAAEATGMKLRLVAHFIKREEAPTALAQCRFERLRLDFARRWRALRTVLEELPAVRHYVTGLDAAANELHTPPEAFAPLYRAARGFGLVNFTYHVGEDFPHLLSGIRAIAEAIQFLGLQRGNRLGHATAIGIDPELYLARMPRETPMRRGDRLDDLVFAHRAMTAAGGSVHARLAIESEIRTLSQAIYGVSHRAETLWAAWRLRGLDPLRIDRGPAWRALDPDEEREIALVEQARSDDPEAFSLFNAYHTAEVARRSAAVSPDVATGAIGAEDLTALQDWVMRHLVIAKGIALETLPTSNVRISFYRHHGEHHLYRWLGLKGDHPTPVVCVGSDDPGIFACNLRGEYMHVFREIKHLIGDEHRARTIIQQLNDAGRLYHFAYGLPPATGE